MILHEIIDTLEDKYKEMEMRLDKIERLMGVTLNSLYALHQVVHDILKREYSWIRENKIGMDEQ